jgi:hypothetical protein
LYTECFGDFEAAERWLYRRWAGLPFHIELIDTHCAGAIYDHGDSRKRIFTIGAAHLLDDASAVMRRIKTEIQRLSGER